ncbi:acyltransferase [Nocardia colli]|uniref:Phthiocerol/phthiodiolone dimycocerosyl transferase n=1 Tax=Nocardia colli TaxID=2545717 RepID=A0A5N0ECP1_9NOCA|nr:acyltransferase [Nocardia colli]KAA8887217.1 acyltransferase [Nocardia colli]
MTTSTVVRPLDPSELMFAGVGAYVGYAVEVSGRLDLTALSAAYAAVVRAYPVFGARLEPSDDGGHVLVTSTATPEISVVDDDSGRLLIDQKFDQRVALSAVCVVRAGDTASVTLLTHHSVADAYHSLAVLAELWSCYTDAVAGHSLDRRVRPYPASIEELLAERGVEKMTFPDPDEQPAVSAPATDPVVDEDGWQSAPQVSRCRLSTAETAALIELGHREGVTINGLVSAAVLLSEAEIRELPLTELLYIYPVDLRTRITPTAGLTDGTNLLGFATYTPAEPAGLLDLARGICESLRVALAAGIVQQTPLHIPEMGMSAIAPVPGLVIMTNWGRVPELRAPEGLRINDFRSTLTAATDLGAPPQPGGTCILSTFDGRLSIEIHHSKAAAAQQQRRVDSFAARLRAAIS